jgi:hypothetical protein
VYSFAQTRVYREGDQADSDGSGGGWTAHVRRDVPVSSVPTLRFWWPDNEASQPIATGLARGFGAREVGLGLGILSALVRNDSLRGWILVAASDAADVVLTLTNSYSFGPRARLINLASGALFIPLELYLGSDPGE